MTPSESLHVPPQALDAEMAVLGSMLIQAEAVETASDYLQEEHFYRDAHRKIFRAILNLCEKGQLGVDVVTVGEELRRLKWLGEVGGAAYLSELVHKVSTAAHVEHYARIVLDKAILRDLIRTSTEVVSQCYGEEKEPTQILDEAQGRILQVAAKQKVQDFYSAKQLTKEVVAHIERLHQRKVSVTGVPSGFLKFDQMTAGFQKGDLILIAARPSQGKTALALNMAAQMVLQPSQPIAVAVFSLEMTREAIMTRLIAAEARMDLHKMRTGYFSKDRWVDLTNAAAKFHGTPLYINDGAGLSVLEVRSRARRLAADLRAKGQELGVVFIDYLQLMRGASRRTESRQQEVAEISRGLKQLARDLNIPVIALSQLSRRVEEKGRGDQRPQLSDLRESGALEQDADLVGFIYREGYYKRDDPTVANKAEVIIAKQRNGPTGIISLVFRSELARFENETAASEPEGESQADFVASIP